MTNLAVVMSTPSPPRSPVQSVEVNETQADREAMRALARGDVSALGELYDRHQAGVRRFVERAASGNADVDDLVHATFLALHRSAASFDASRSVYAWLIGIAARLVHGQRSKGARWARLLRGFRPVRPASSADPERVLEARQELGRLERALVALSEAKRVVLIMHEIEGLSGEEIATSLEIPVGTVWTRLHHARRELMAVLEEES